MKSYLKMLIVPFFLIGTTWLLISSCENDSSPLSPNIDEADVRDAYVFLVEAHAVKQEGMLTIIKAFSNDYKSKFLAKKMTKKQLMTVAETLDSFAQFAVENEDKLRESETIFTHYNGPKKDLKGSMVDFWGWISGSSKRARTRVLTVASNLSKEERSKLFNDWLRDETKQEVENEDDFWKKLENGDLDTKANSIFADFNNNLEFIEMAQEKDLDIHKIFVKEGAEGVNKGATVLIEAVKEATPLGEGMGMVENAADFVDNAEKSVDSPLDGVDKLDQVENAIKDYLNGYIPIDEIIDNSEMAKDLSESIKNLYNTSKGAANPENWVNKNPKWGGVKIVDESKTGKECDIVIAENTHSNNDNLTKVIIGLSDLLSNSGVDMVLPEGNWEFKSVDVWGNFEKQIADVIAGTISELSVFSDPDENGDDDGEDEQSKDLTGRWDGTLVIEEINFVVEDIEEDEEIAEGCEVEDFGEIDLDQYIGVEQPFVLQLEKEENSQEYEATMIIYEVEDELTSGFSENSSMKTAYNIYSSNAEGEEVIYLNGIFSDNSLTLTGKEEGFKITYVGEFEIKGEDKYTLTGYWLMGTSSKPEMMTGSWSSERLPPEFWK